MPRTMNQGSWPDCTSSHSVAAGPEIHGYGAEQLDSFASQFITVAVALCLLQYRPALVLIAFLWLLLPVDESTNAV